MEPAPPLVQGDARPLVADDVVEVEDLALLRRWRVPTPACPSAPARRCRRWSSRIRATRCCRPCSRRRPRPLPLGGRLPAGALLRVRIEGQLRWKVGVRQADYEAGEECEIWTATPICVQIPCASIHTICVMFVTCYSEYYLTRWQPTKNRLHRPLSLQDKVYQSPRLLFFSIAKRPLSFFGTTYFNLIPSFSYHCQTSPICFLP